MKITLSEPELELEVIKVDIPTGVAWCVMLPGDRKLLVKFRQGKWESEDNVSTQFVQAIGDEIDQFLKSVQPAKICDSYSSKFGILRSCDSNAVKHH